MGELEGYSAVAENSNFTETIKSTFVMKILNLKIAFAIY